MYNNYKELLRSIKLNISFFRKKNNLTQEELAEKLNISRTHLSNIEALNMDTNITLVLLFEIACVLKVNIENLIELR